jgi:hypothetical protein
MKTAMQELIEIISTMEMDGRIQKYESAEAQINFYYDLKKLLQKEKEQIADAFRNGSTSSMLGGGHWTQYYNQTYNQNK